jgi:hypothetical protein
MDYLQKQQDSHFAARLDNKDYDPSSLVEIKVPVSLPYQTDWKEFERVDGEIEFNGMHYKYVERKLEAGEMIYRCIPDKDKAQMLNARENFFKLVNDLQTQTSNKKSGTTPAHTYKTFSFDYCETLSHWYFSKLEIKQSLCFIHTTQALLTAMVLTPEQPPEA